MEHDLTPGFQNCKIGWGGISKMAAVTKNSKNNKNQLLNFGMESQWNIGIQNCKNEKICSVVFFTVTYFLFTSVFLLKFLCLKITFKQLHSIKPLHQLSNFT